METINPKPSFWLFYIGLPVFLNFDIIYFVIIFQYLMNKVGLDSFPGLQTNQWTTNTTKKGSLLIINSLTADQFKLIKIKGRSTQLEEFFNNRSQFTLPNTPQIILAGTQTDPTCIEMFVQIAPFTTADFYRQNQHCQSLQDLIKNVIRTVQILVKKFGFFKITSEMLKFSRSYSLVIWVHQAYYQIGAQYPLICNTIYQCYQTMITDILDLLDSPKYHRKIQGLKCQLLNQSVLSFQKFRVISQKYLTVKNTYKQKSFKMYHTPQFLKRRATQGCPYQNTTQQFISDSLNNNQPRYRTQFFKQINDSKIKTTRNNDFLSSKVQNIYQPKTWSSRIIPHHEQQPFSEKKKNFRDSGKTASTTAFLRSISSSGKIKIGSEFNGLPIVKSMKSLNSEAMGITGRGKNGMKQPKQNFQVKASKIIYENEEQGTNTFQSTIMKPEQNKRKLDSEILRDLDDLLQSEHCSDTDRHATEAMDLQTEFYNILKS